MRGGFESRHARTCTSHSSIRTYYVRNYRSTVHGHVQVWSRPETAVVHTMSTFFVAYGPGRAILTESESSGPRSRKVGQCAPTWLVLKQRKYSANKKRWKLEFDVFTVLRWFASLLGKNFWHYSEHYEKCPEVRVLLKKNSGGGPQTPRRTPPWGPRPSAVNQTVALHITIRRAWRGNAVVWCQTSNARD